MVKLRSEGCFNNGAAFTVSRARAGCLLAVVVLAALVSERDVAHAGAAGLTLDPVVEPPTVNEN